LHQYAKQILYSIQIGFITRFLFSLYIVHCGSTHFTLLLHKLRLCGISCVASGFIQRIHCNRRDRDEEDPS